jgi:hypothetical protein
LGGVDVERGQADTRAWSSYKNGENEVEGDTVSVVENIDSLDSSDALPRSSCNVALLSRSRQYTSDIAIGSRFAVVFKVIVYIKLHNFGKVELTTGLSQQSVRLVLRPVACFGASYYSP